MDGNVLGPVPAGCRERLVSHYGPAVGGWLKRVPRKLAEAARRCEVRLAGYHNAGCASVLAVGSTGDGQPVVLKAWYSRVRYRRELAALRAWPRGVAPGLIAAADDLAVAAMGLIAGRPGGARRPRHEAQAVALALGHLHRASRAPDGLPQLRDYVEDTIRPRIAQRSRLGTDIPTPLLAAIDRVDADGLPPVLLHADLYRENVLFTEQGRPVFCDPLPMVGTAAFDWAFWVAYYDLAADPVARLRLAVQIGRIPVARLVPWCVTLCVDGLLYYRDTDDPRATRMVEVLHALAAYDRQGAPC